MNSFLILACTLACAYATPVSDSVATVIRSESVLNPEGDFLYQFETDNGIKSRAQGTFKSVGKDEIALVVTGANQFVAPDGQTYEVVFTADENGYQPQGAHLPTPPPTESLPENVARALQYIEAHAPPPKEETYQKPGYKL